MNEIIKKYEEFAKEKGIKLNSDRELVENIIKAMLKKEEMFGERYCPCRRLTEDKEKNKDLICPCISCLEEVEKQGHCHCQLFVKK